MADAAGFKDPRPKTTFRVSFSLLCGLRPSVHFASIARRCIRRKSKHGAQCPIHTKLPYLTSIMDIITKQINESGLLFGQESLIVI